MKEWTMERISLMALVGLLSWNVHTTQSLQTDMAVIKTKVDGALENRYTAVEAIANNERVDERIERLESLNQNLSNRLSDVEEYIRNKEKSKH